MFTGCSPTFFGCPAQAAFNYEEGCEFFKKFHGDLVGLENAARHKTGVYLKNADCHSPICYCYSQWD